MQKERSQFKAGLFIIIGTLLILVVVIAIKGIKTVFTPVEERRVRFGLTDNIGGLRIGDELRIGGYKVGIVRNIELQGLGDGSHPSLLVTFYGSQRIHPARQRAHQDRDTRDGHQRSEHRRCGQRNAARAKHGVGRSSQLADRAGGTAWGDAGPDLRDVMHDVKTITLPKVNLAAGKAGDTLGSITRAGDEVSSILGDSKPDFRGTVANLHTITGDVKSKLPAMLDHIDTIVVKTTATIDSARGTLDDIKATGANAKQITDSVRTLIGDNRGKIETMIASLKTSGDNLKGATAEIRRSPWRLLYHPGPGELDNLELYDAARQFSEGAGSLNDSALALRDALNNPNVDRKQVEKLIDQLNKSFRRLQHGRR